MNSGKKKSELANVLDELYLAALNRPARPSERANVLRKMQLRAGFRDSAKAGYEDLFWALLNSSEFNFRH